MSKNARKLVVLLFDSQGKPPPAKHAHEYVFVGDAGGGTYIRGVTKSYPAQDPADPNSLSPYSAAMDDWDKFARKGEGCTNTVPAIPIASAESAAIYIAVRGGCVQGVRYKAGAGIPTVFLVDYDNNDRDLRLSEETFERECLDGKTWDEIEKTSEGVF